MDSPLLPEHLPTGVTPQGDGIASGYGKVKVDAYIDFLCPFCRQFEVSAASTLDELLAADRITLIYHPMNFLDEASSTRYSTRAAAAAGCASDEGQFLGYVSALFRNQPAEGGPGLTDNELAEIGASAGLNPERFGAAIAEGRYVTWPDYVTAKAQEAGVSGTPTVFVAGSPVEPDPEVIRTEVDRAELIWGRRGPSGRGPRSRDGSPRARRLLGRGSLWRRPRAGD
jgi:protein-disulfide isomerase